MTKNFPFKMYVIIYSWGGD